MQAQERTKVAWPTSDAPGSLHLFGDPCLCWQGQPHPMARRQPQALFYYLALQAQPVTRPALCRIFWPEEPTAVANRRLTHVLDDLKRSLPTPDLLVKENETITLNTTHLAIDAYMFLELTGPTATIQPLTQAMALYQAPLLAKFVLSKHPAFELWLLGERETWEARYLGVLARLVEQQSAARQWQGAIRNALCYLHRNVTDEAMHRTLIELYGRLGDRDAVQRQYRWCVRVLAHELGVQPTPATEAVCAAAQQMIAGVRFPRFTAKL